MLSIAGNSTAIIVMPHITVGGCHHMRHRVP